MDNHTQRALDIIHKRYIDHFESARRLISSSMSYDKEFIISSYLMSCEFVLKELADEAYVLYEHEKYLKEEKTDFEKWKETRANLLLKTLDNTVECLVSNAKEYNKPFEEDDIDFQNDGIW